MLGKTRIEGKIILTGLGIYLTDEGLAIRLHCSPPSSRPSIYQLQTAKGQIRTGLEYFTQRDPEENEKGPKRDGKGNLFRANYTSISEIHIP